MINEFELKSVVNKLIKKHSPNVNVANVANEVNYLGDSLGYTEVDKMKILKNLKENPQFSHIILPELQPVAGLYFAQDASQRAQKLIKNLCYFESVDLFTMARPYDKTDPFNQDPIFFSKNMKSFGKIKKIVALDLDGWPYSEYKKSLSEQGIEYITDPRVCIRDFFYRNELTAEKIDFIVDFIMCQQKLGGVSIHCASGNGRSGVIASAIGIKKYYLSTCYTNQLDKKSLLSGAASGNSEYIQVDRITSQVVHGLRRENPKLVERHEDINALNLYSIFLYSKYRNGSTPSA